MSSDDIYADQAKHLVDEVIDHAIRRLETSLSLNDREKTLESIKFSSELNSRQSTFAKDENYEVKDIKWLTVDDFTEEKAEIKIQDYIKTWQFENSWQYCIDFLGEDPHDYDVRYRFRLRWSIPTRRKPIPRATACVYFSFVVSTIKPKHFPVDVFFVFEGNRLVHKPGESRFREKWLKDIIESKVMMQQMVTF